MMHSYEYDDRVCFNFNSDFSGDLIISITQPGLPTTYIEIPAEAVLELVAYCYVLPARFAMLHDADFKDLLQGTEP